MNVDCYIAVDLETTGLNPKEDQILEIGAVKMRKGEPVEQFQTLVQCLGAIPERVVALTGITNEMMETGLPLEEAWSRWEDFCTEEVLLGHNLQFDYSFLKQSAINQKKKFERQGMDTLKIARILLPELPSRRLGSLCDYFAIPSGRSHRAMDDAWATAQLFETMKAQYGEKNETLFVPKLLNYRAKRQSPATEFQKAYLKDLVNYHTIDAQISWETLSKSEASRQIDKIILQYGRIKR